MSPPQDFRPCPLCGKTAHVRQDGTLGLHYSINNKHLRRRCPNSGMRYAGRSDADPRPRPRRRVQVTLDVVLPDTWTLTEYKTAAAALLRAHLDNAFLVDVNVEETA